jgi:hypothetical protein
MIIKIHGGIGNQLYQYAFALSIRRQFGLDIYVNLDFFSSNMKYVRKPLEISEKLQLATSKNSIKKNIFSKLYKKLKNTKFQYLMYLANEKFGNFIEENQKYGFRFIMFKRDLNGILLDGYFTDYRYLSNGINELKEAFQQLTQNIQFDYDGYIAFHIRRGDYEKIMRTRSKSNILDIKYYERSLSKINSSIRKIRVYTDDYQWAKEKLPLLFKTYNFDFSPEFISDIDSLWTMSKHEYIIAANSTFSLWAYYFNRKNIKCFTFPMEWAESIHNKGYMLFDNDYSNVILVKEN